MDLCGGDGCYRCLVHPQSMSAAAPPGGKIQPRSRLLACRALLVRCFSCVDAAAFNFHTADQQRAKARSNPGAGRCRRRLRRRGKIQSRSLLPRAAAFNSRLPHRCCRSSSCSTAAASRKDEVEHTSMNLWRHRRFSSRQNDLAAWDRPESSSVEDDEYFARAKARIFQLPA